MAQLVQPTEVPAKPRVDAAEGTGFMATPIVAAAFSAGVCYMWLEAAFRLVFTYTTLATTYVLWNGRAGDIAAMWLTISVVSLVVFFVLRFLVFKNRTQVWSIKMWTIVLIVLAIAAPLIGEIGTPQGI